MMPARALLPLPPPLRLGAVGARCPLCRDLVILDRHGLLPHGACRGAGMRLAEAREAARPLSLADGVGTPMPEVDDLTRVSARVVDACWTVQREGRRLKLESLALRHGEWEVVVNAASLDLLATLRGARRIGPDSIHWRDVVWTLAR